MELKYKRAGIVVKPHNDVKVYLERTLEILKELNVEVVLEKLAAEMLGQSSLLKRWEVGRESDIIILIGGDGTFLSVASQAVENQVPVAGFNLGTLGFLTELKKEDLDRDLEMIFSGQAKINRRKLLELHYHHERYIALNDVVAGKGDIARTIRLLLAIDGTQVTEISTDGIIISTPTGSTGYSLSAAGPIVSPKVSALIITPICPHSLTMRPLVVPDNVSVQVTLTSDINAYITVDGQKVLPMHSGDSFESKIHDQTLQMVESSRLNYFKLLNEKLNWGL